MPFEKRVLRGLLGFALCALPSLAHAADIETVVVTAAPPDPVGKDTHKPDRNRSRAPKFAAAPLHPHGPPHMEPGPGDGHERTKVGAGWHKMAGSSPATTIAW